MAVGQVLVRRASAGSGLGGLQKPVVSADDLLGEPYFPLRRLTQVEMRGPFLLNAHVENRLAVIATHGLQMRFDNARDLIYLSLGVAFGRGHPIAFTNAQSFADLRFANFAKTVEVENIDTQILRVY
jgi:hypothetical protein